jgi:hypothetical protein
MPAGLPVAALIERVRILCTVYDPDTGKLPLQLWPDPRDRRRPDLRAGDDLVLRQRMAESAPAAPRPCAAHRRALASRPWSSARPTRDEPCCSPAQPAPAGNGGLSLGSSRRSTGSSERGSIRCAIWAALGFLLFWVLAVSGIYSTSVFDTSVQGAYRSIDRLSRQPWYVGGLLRSLHRYAPTPSSSGDACCTCCAKACRALPAAFGVSWLTGVPLLLLAFTSAIGGFWLNWDQLGQFSALATAEWLDVLPLFASPLTRNFLTAARSATACSRCSSSCTSACRCC